MGGILFCAGLGNGETRFHIQSNFFGVQIHDSFFINENYVA
jgi:hypothetical protein